MEDDRQTDDQTGAIEAAGCDKRGESGSEAGWGECGGVGGGGMQRELLALGGGNGPSS